MKFTKDDSQNYNCCTDFSDSILRYLNEDQKMLLEVEKQCSVHKKNDIVYHEGNKPHGVYLIEQGVLKIYKTGNDGREQIIRFAKKGDLIGFRSVISNEVLCSSAKVIENCRVCFISANVFLNFVKENSEFSMQLIKLSCKELGESNKFIIDLALKSLRERLAEVIILLTDTFGLDAENFIQVVLTREDIANIVGTATESIIRQLSDLKREHLIDLKGKRIKILDLNKLRKISGL